MNFKICSEKSQSNFGIAGKSPQSMSHVFNLNWLASTTINRLAIERRHSRLSLLFSYWWRNFWKRWHLRHSFIGQSFLGPHSDKINRSANLHVFDRLKSRLNSISIFTVINCITGFQRATHKCAVKILLLSPPTHYLALSPSVRTLRKRVKQEENCQLINSNQWETLLARSPRREKWKAGQ